MTGISDVFRSCRNVSRLASAWWLLAIDLLPTEVARFLRGMFTNGLLGDELECPQPLPPDPRPTILLHEMLRRQRPVTNTNEVVHALDSKRWAIMLPMTSRGCSPAAFWTRLESTLNHLLDSIPNSADRLRSQLRVCVDTKDPVLDNAGARERITGFLSQTGIEVVFEDALPPAYESKLCWIWALMAKKAVADGADFLLLLGDDVELKTADWQLEVENEFRIMSEELKLPFGAGCVALQDESFPAFPTFPIIHKFHMAVFEDKLFPDQFINQHGDPFLFEIWRRFGAARFTPRAKVVNTLGGSHTARYTKDSSLIWRGEILTRAIDKLALHLGANGHQIPCIDVVVPTYRCDPSMLRHLATMNCVENCSVHTLIVVDRPDAPTLSEIRALTSYAANRVVRVYVMPENAGASAARNTGLAQSFGDHCVLLDDDVVPQDGLLDAYLSAISRHPDAVAYVGNTRLPAASTLIQQAIVASKIDFFYSIACKVAQPPWGVTANLCVKSRTNNDVWFDKRFPKTGGGEDVDFCFNLQYPSRGVRRGYIVSVPNAVVMHPFWAYPFRQVAGWASGDVLCLETQPRAAFRVPPNWIEISMVCVLCGFWREAIAVVLLEVILLWISYVPETQRSKPLHERAVIGVLATLPCIIQDVVRLCSKLSRGRFWQLCLSFDWMDGHGDHAPAAFLTLAIKNAFFVLLVLMSWHRVARTAYTVSLIVGVSAWGLLQRKVMLDAPLPVKSLKLESTATKFVVLACQRTGSNLLCGLLHHVGAISMHNELYNNKGCFSHCTNTMQNIDLHERDRNPGKLLQEAYAVSASEGGAIGFKLFPEHIRRSAAHHALFGRLLGDPLIKKIILRRKSRIATCVSMVRAQVTGSYTNAQLGSVPVHITPSDYQRFCSSYDLYYRFLDRATLGQNVLRVDYEQLVVDPEGVVALICEFLGVPRGESKLKSIFKKQSAGNRFTPNKSDIANWDELLRAFQGCVGTLDNDV